MELASLKAAKPRSKLKRISKTAAATDSAEAAEPGMALVGHTVTPSHVPARANIAALKSIGVRAIIAFSAVGSLHYCVMEGPQFSTRAESGMYRLLGGDLINMSVLPEAKLAREIESSYALIATATDYDSWCPASSSVTAAEVFKTLKANADTSRLVAATVLDDLHKAITGNEASVFLEEVGGMKFSIMPRSGEQKKEDKKKLAYVLPEYFGEGAVYAFASAGV
ncbi:nucleoside phosphorylase domain-containing protein [Cyathus striatus]|nr:nucleoside phosphorylase domain-containing protein [Cyathus striatus]